MFFVRQNATHKIVIGPAVAVGDGFTPVTNLAVSSADEAEAILHDNGTVVDISAYTFAAITTADGYYHLTLASGITSTVGHVTIVINDDSLILPIRTDYTVVEEAVYDALFAASAPGYLQPTVAARTLDVTEAGTAGIDWGNVENPTTAVDLSATDIQLCDTITTYTGNTVQTGDTYALANGATGFTAIDTVVDAILLNTGTDGVVVAAGSKTGYSLAANQSGVTIGTVTTNTDMRGTDSAATASALSTHDGKLDTVDGIVDAILLDTAQIGTAGAGLTAIPWNASWNTEVQSEVNDALVAQKLDHLVAVADSDDPVNNSIIAKLASSAATADWSTFDNQTDSLQGIREEGDLNWSATTAGSGARTVTITVNDGSDPLENVVISLAEGVNVYTNSTNASGIAVFNLSDATYVVAMVKSGYSYSGTSLVVNGTEDETYSMSLVALTPASEVTQVTGYFYAYDEEGIVEASVTFTVQQTRVPAGYGESYDSAERSLTSDGEGLVEITGLVIGGQFRIRRGSSYWKYFAIPSSATSPWELPNFLGVD